MKKNEKAQRRDAENKSRLARRASLWMVKSKEKIINAISADLCPPNFFAMKNIRREEMRNKEMLMYLHDITSPLKREKVSKARGA